MSMNELQLVLNAMTTLGAAGKEAFIWWLVMEKGLAFICGMSVIALGVFITVSVRNSYSDSKRLQTLRDIMHVGAIGHITDSEFREMVEWVTKRRNWELDGK